MEPKLEQSRSIDVSGLSGEAVRAVESLVASLREQTNGSAPQRSAVEWCKALREWAESHKKLEHAADWSRESIYAGRGE